MKSSSRTIVLALSGCLVAAVLPAQNEVIKVTNKNGQTIVYPQAGDPGFPSNGFSYPAGSRCRPTSFRNAGCVTGRLYDDPHPAFFSVTSPVWLPTAWQSHRGNAFHHQQAAKKVKRPLHSVRVLDPQGRPVVGAKVRMERTGYRVAGIVGVTDRHGAFDVTLRQPKRTHRFTVIAAGFQPAELLLTGGRLDDAIHQIRLEPEAPMRPPRIHRAVYLAESERALPADVERSYRRGLAALEREDWLTAAGELRLAVERWPVPTTIQDDDDSALDYQPYQPLATALDQLGEESLAEAWRGRGAELSRVGG